FPFRYTWLKKGVDAVTDDPTVFGSDRATITLGVGKNMVRSIRHWCTAAGLVQAQADRARLEPTKLGKAIFADEGFDPYLEDSATLWLIHAQLTSKASRAATWYWAFGFFNQNEFRKDIFASELMDWTGKNGWNRISENSIHRDVDCFLRTYVPSRMTKGTIMEDSFNCPLVELGLISDSSDALTYQFHRGEKPSLPAPVFAAVLSRLWESRFSDRNSLALAEIAYLPESPGQIFKLDEDSVVGYLEELESLTDGSLRYDETAGLKQVYREKTVDEIELLRNYYRQSS
ncbi:MAG: DUF4007 family protein, partial [Candidatus Poribacteria bacterium]|nr:DUF4007 family protein [Candidatus Poribacteria bacterium]